MRQNSTQAMSVDRSQVRVDEGATRQVVWKLSASLSVTKASHNRGDD